MNDRRQETRKKVMAFTPVYDRERNSVIGYLGNLTLNGMMIIGEKPLDENSIIKLMLDFRNDLPEISATKLIIDARVARCAPDDESTRDFRIGVEFTNVNEAHTKIIQAILNRYHFRHRSQAEE
jgi:c-di-GMP-binding flagellar brake protein YcgR